MKKLISIGMLVLFTGCSVTHTESSTPEENVVLNEKPVEIEETEEYEPNSQISEEVFEEEKNDQQLETISIPLVAHMQETSYYCVPACVQSVLELHGLNISQQELADQMHTHTVTGTEYADLARVINSYVFDTETPAAGQPGYRVQTLDPRESSDEAKALFFERIKTDLNSNDPIFCAIDRNGIFNDLSSANHMILVTGGEMDADTKELISLTIFDPYPYENKGGPFFSVSADQLWDSLVQNVEPAYIW